jgi:hypothetical protein
MAAFTFEYTGSLDRTQFLDDWAEYRQLNPYPVVHFEFLGNAIRAWTESAILTEDGLRRALREVLHRQGCELV